VDAKTLGNGRRQRRKRKAAGKEHRIETANTRAGNGKQPKEICTPEKPRSQSGGEEHRIETANTRAGNGKQPKEICTPEKLAPKPNAVEVLLPLEEVQESQAPRQRREKPKGLSHVAGDDTPISDSDLETIAVMKPRAILEMFGEGRITAALIGLGVTEDEMPDSGAQKAAMLKQRKK
jgi:hypothetical protein